MPAPPRSGEEVKATHSVETLRELMDERDRRYSDNRKCDQDAVKLAKEIADKAKGTVNIVALIAVAGLILSLIDRFR